MSEQVVVDAAETGRLLWRLADRFTGRAPAVPTTMRRPSWFDRAGDLVVVDGTVSWQSPGVDGGFCHSVPPGTHPVYVGTFAGIEDDWQPDGIRYHASMIVLPLAEPARIASAEWDEGYDDYQALEDYALLWDSRAERAAVYAGGQPTLFPAARNRILTEGRHYRRANWVNQVVDEASGANVLVVPAAGEAVYGYEARDSDGDLTCLVFLGCWF
jgi:hypothetical protein